MNRCLVAVCTLALNVAPMRADDPAVREKGREGAAHEALSQRKDWDAAKEVLKRPPATGLFVFDVLGDSQAAKAGIQLGDIITHYDGQPVATHSDLTRLARIANDDKRQEILLLVHRGGNELELTVPRGPIGVRLEDVVAGEERILPQPRGGISEIDGFRCGVLDHVLQTGGQRWKLVYVDAANQAPVGWCRHYLEARTQGEYTLRIQQYLKPNDAAIRQDVVVEFDAQEHLTPIRMRLSVNDKLLLDVRREKDRYVGLRAGVPVSAEAKPSAVSAYLAPYVASLAIENLDVDGMNCDYIPPGSLEAAPLSEITVDIPELLKLEKDPNYKLSGRGSFLLRKLGREEMRGEILPGGEIGTIHLRGGIRIEPATKDQVLAAFPDALRLFTPIEQLPKDAQAATQRAN